MWYRRSGKFNARKTVADGMTFDSHAESQMYLQLRLLQRAGKIKDLKTQVPFELQPAYKQGKVTIRAIKYVADFTFWDNEQGKYRVIDCKGMKTPVYLLKRKIFEYINRELGLRIEERI